MQAWSRATGSLTPEPEPEPMPVPVPVGGTARSMMSGGGEGKLTG